MVDQSKRAGRAKETGAARSSRESSESTLKLAAAVSTSQRLVASAGLNVGQPGILVEREHASGSSKLNPARVEAPYATSVYNREFYARPTVTVARELIGAQLHRRFPDGTLFSAPIVEVEAYTENDPACHAFRGITERCKVMFGPPGIAYVYFIYGRYNCLNVVTEPDGVPGAILIRALGITGGTGPGKLCDTWQIDRSYNGVDFTTMESTLWIASGSGIADLEVGETVRIGVTSGQDRVWRFYLKGNEFVSGPRKLGGGKRTISGGIDKRMTS